MRRFISCCLSYLRLTVLVLALSASGHAATFTVTKTVDTNDGACDADCSLREAITAANNAVGADTITVPTGTYVLTGAVNDDANISGDLDVTSSMAINGSGPSQTIIDANGIERIFDCFPGSAITFNLNNLTVRNGNPLSASFKTGGAIYLHNNVTSTFTNCGITNSRGDSGGAIDARGPLAMDHCTVSNNLIPVGITASEGGAIRSIGGLTLTACTFSGNSGQATGGAIFLNMPTGITANITSCTFSGNSATVNGASGGLGGAIGASGNQGQINITNCTFSGNSAQNHGGALYVSSSGASTTLLNVTVAGNTADSDTSSGGNGGGIFVAAGTVSLKNTLVANNTDNSSPFHHDVSGSFTNNGNNLIGKNDGSNFSTGTLVGSIASPVNPQIDVLADNGGPTQTRALLSNSPAINAGNDSGAPTTDQRGVSRQGTTDIGSYEFADTTPPTVTINQAGGQADPTASSPILFSVVFSESVSNFATGDVTLTGTANATTATVSGSGTTYSVSVSGMTQAGTVIASIGANKATDAAGNGNTASTANDNTISFVPLNESLVVTTTADENDGTSDPTYGSGTSLREAVTYANSNADASVITFSDGSGGTVNFQDATPEIITLGGTQLSLGSNLTISGPGVSKLSVNGNNTGSVFNVAAGNTVAIHDLTVTGGKDSAGKGGGIINLGNLTLTAVIVTGNTSTTNGVGGIYSTGTLSLVDSTIRNNTATVTDAAAAGLYSTGSTTLTNSTISDNTSAGGAGGILQAGGNLTLTNSTVSGNRTDNRGGGVLVSAGATVDLLSATITANHANNDNTSLADETGGGLRVIVGSVTLSNTIIAANYVGSGSTAADDVIGSITANFSLIGDTTGATITGGDNLAGNAQLGPLANNGGSTQTHALLFGSPAIDAGSTLLTTDQRGFTRPQGTAADIGAVEVQATYSITGYARVGNVTPLAGVSIQLSSIWGNAGSAVTTDANGFYRITGVPAGGYLVSPTLSGWTFSPTGQSLTISNANRAANFIATSNNPTYSVSGRVQSSGVAMSGATLTLTPATSGVSSPITTNSAGYYTFSGVPDGSYTIMPGMTGVLFSPTSRSVTVTGGNVTGQNFIGNTGYGISGRISDANSVAIANVTVTIPGAGSATTNSAGYYTFTNIPNGSYTLTPALDGYIFTPTSRSVEVNGATVSSQNFIGSTGYTISGRVATSSGIAISGVAVTLDGGATTVSNSAGYYTFYNVANGSHTLAPGKGGYTFVPAQKTVTINNANLGSQNFTGTGA